MSFLMWPFTSRHVIKRDVTVSSSPPTKQTTDISQLDHAWEHGLALFSPEDALLRASRHVTYSHQPLMADHSAITSSTKTESFPSRIDSRLFHLCVFTQSDILARVWPQHGVWLRY